MSEYIKVAVDAMGGDYAPQEPVKGVVEALREKPELYVYLVGQEDVLKKNWINIRIRKNVWKLFMHLRSLKPENRRYTLFRKRKTPLW